AFEEMRAERMVQAQAAFGKQQERIAHLQKFIARFKAKASKAKQAQSRVKALARMEKLAPVLTASDFSFEFREPLSLPNPMLAMDSMACGYGQTIIVRDINRSVLAGQRIGILGANGQGKSTLVKTVARTMPPLGGTLTEGKGLAIGYFAQQEMDVLRPGDTREALAMARNEFEGTVMLVSHDRALLREVCDEFWLVAGGAVKPFDGDLDDYQRWLLDTAREQAKALRDAAAPPKTGGAPNK